MEVYDGSTPEPTYKRRKRIAQHSLRDELIKVWDSAGQVKNHCDKAAKGELMTLEDLSGSILISA
jgi:hypothetical protein